jgi:ATP-dependent RNA helicase RhlB
MAETHLTDTRFDSFDLDPRILQGLADAGFVNCTPIQAETLPLALAGRDVAGQAQTGTGKTAAFLLAILQRLLAHPGPAVPAREQGQAHPRALILAPTRELAVQIHKDTLTLAAHTGFRVGLVFGGTGYQEQREYLADGVDILVGTPGRLIDYFKQHVFSLKAVEVVVLDEADRMFDLGFIKDIRFVFKRMPPPEERQGMLFSATLSYRVLELAYEHMNQPQMVKIESDYMTANAEKIQLLIGLVRSWQDPRAMVFVNTKREADRVWGYLQGNGINTAVLSGDVPQKTRLKLLKRFTDGDLPVLVGTDVAARGLHIPDVTHVVNYDLPEDAEDYVHRIGRTARAGADGDAVSFVCETYAFCLPDIEKFIGAKVPVGRIEAERLARVDPRSRLRPDREDREYRQEGRGGHGGHGERGRGGPRDGRRPEGERPRRGDRPQGAERAHHGERGSQGAPGGAPGGEPGAEGPPVAGQPQSGETAQTPERAPRGERRDRPQPQDRPARRGPGRREGAEPAPEAHSAAVPAESGAPEQPDSPPVARRRGRHEPERAALTSVSPPGGAPEPAEPAPQGLAPEVAEQSGPADRDGGPALGSGEAPAKKRRRRRRRKPAAGPEGQAEMAEAPAPGVAEDGAED